MSNLLFAGSLNTTALGQKALFMSLLHTGSAIGNAISLQNIIMVKSVIPDNISESRILKFNLPIIGIYVVLVLISTLIYVR
jgi:L-lactate permease